MTLFGKFPRNFRTNVESVLVSLTIPYNYSSITFYDMRYVLVLYRCIPTLVGDLLVNGSVIQNVAGTNMTKAVLEKGIELVVFY